MTTIELISVGTAVDFAFKKDNKYTSVMDFAKAMRMGMVEINKDYRVPIVVFVNKDGEVKSAELEIGFNPGMKADVLEKMLIDISDHF